MPLLKGTASKALPDDVIRYVTNPKKAAVVDVLNLFEDEDYAKQFNETMNMFNKGKKYDERKYYHFKLSCARKDNVSVEEAQIYAIELADRLFHDYECVIATHTDTKTIHSHIVVNAVNPITGKKLHITRSDYTSMKDEANDLGVEMGFSYTDFRSKAKNKRTTEEKKIILKGGTSWKEELREVIEEAKQTASTEDEFKEHLKLYGVKITRSNKEYTYLHPNKEKGIRGNRLGENYTKKEIENVISENRYRRSCKTIGRIDEDVERADAEIGNDVTERSVSHIQRELQRINKQAEYADKGIDYESGEIKRREREQQKQIESNSGIPTGKDGGINRAGKNVQISHKPKCRTVNNYNSR